MPTMTQRDYSPTALTVADRPDLVEPASLATMDLLPEYNRHGDVFAVYWQRLTQEIPAFQFHLVDGDDRVLARARSIPVRWDGTIEDLPEGIDGALARGFQGEEPNALCALLVAVPRSVQQRGVSSRALVAMSDLARDHGFESLIAPVRPSLKERYPLAPIESYAAWRREDGALFDPWMRVHERLGANVLKAEPHSMRISSTVADWQDWTGMTYPQSGSYWFPGGLATLCIDQDRDQGLYFEPNVWMHHAL